jgi:LysR family transcriptional regulator, hydrogen peroxide-inducible genes activator
MTITQLEYILALSRYENFSEASKHCFVTQPTLSIQVQKLEDELDVIIFDRSKKPLKPTEIGKKIIEQARVIIQESKRIEEILSESKNILEGEFRLGIIPSVSVSLLPLFLKSFTERYPKIKLVLSELQTVDMLEKLKNEEIDAGIASTPLGDPQLIEKPLYLEPFYLFIHPDNPLFQKKAIAESDLIDQDLLLMSEGHCFRNQVTQICKLRKNKGIYFESGNFQTLISLVEQNIGITLLPSLVVDSIKSPDLKKMVKKIAGTILSREISLIYRRKHLKEGVNAALEKIIISSLPSSLLQINKEDQKIISPKIV